MMSSSYIQELFSLENKVIAVTGASRGIGLEIAKAYSSCGAITIGMGRTKIDSAAMNMQYVKCDITIEESVAEDFSSIQSKYGRLDVLVNAAGITNSSPYLLKPLEVLKETLATNLLATYNTSELASKIMANNGGGSIVNITSIASLQGFPNNPAYVASKGGVSAMSKALALDYAPLGIRVNCVAPGYIHTAMTHNSYSNNEKNAERVARMMIKRWGCPSDLVGASIFLASNASAYITGIELVVDGGWTAKGI